MYPLHNFTSFKMWLVEDLLCWQLFGSFETGWSRAKLQHRWGNISLTGKDTHTHTQTHRQISILLPKQQIFRQAEAGWVSGGYSRDILILSWISAIETFSAFSGKEYLTYLGLQLHNLFCNYQYMLLSGHWQIHFQFKRASWEKGLACLKGRKS